MKSLVTVFAAVLAVGAALPAWAADPRPASFDDLPPAANLPPCAPGSAEQTKKDLALLQPIIADANQRGFAALKEKRAVLEEILSHAPASMNKVEICDGQIVVHVRTPSESLSAMMYYATQAPSYPKGVAGSVAVYSPYATAAFLVGTSYDEDRQWDKAYAALKRGLDVDPLVPSLTTEAALALEELHRAPDALVLCERTLRDNRLLETGDKARLMRCRGYALVELHRFDEAEAAYKDSLTLDPGNRIALSELKEIDEMRKTGKPTTPRTLYNSGTQEPSPHP